MVNRNAPCLSLLILTEDSANDSHETITAVVKKKIHMLVKGVQTQLVEFEPQGTSAARAMHGNLWKSRKSHDRQKLVDLRNSIATKVMEGRDDVPGFVLFHFDGDRPWADRALSENVERFEDFKNQYIRPIVEDALRRRGKEHELETRLSRVHPITPFYSIEAWLFQNTVEACRICEENCGDHLDQIRGWEKDRGQLDEVVQPKSKDFCCLGSECNRSLAERVFPAGEVYSAGKSFEAAVHSLRENKDLVAALDRTIIRTPEL